MHLSDNEILDLCKNPQTKEKGYFCLVNKFQEKVYWHLRKILVCHEDTNDVMQNVFIKVWANLDKFKEESSLYTWIFRISYNEALTFINKNKNKKTISIDGDYEIHLSNSLCSEKHYSANEIENKLQKAILTLSTKQRIVFLMRYYDNLSFNQISEILDTTVNTLKTTYHFASKKIEQFLKEN